jgi:aldose 1-epimerase
VIVRLSAEPDRALVDSTAGGRLASLVAGGRERLVNRPQPGSALPMVSWGSFLMAPWVGRIAQGRLEWRGRAAELPRNEGRHALHGAVFDVPWTVGARGAASVEMSCPIDAQRWPFGGRAWQRLTLGPGSLRFEATVTAAEPMPVALGWHPWFQRGPGEDLAVTVRADRRLTLDAELIPSGATVPVGGAHDLRAGPALGNRRLDDVFIDARGPAIVRWPDLELQLEFEAPLSSVVVFSPAGSVCVEPATAWPDALRLSTAGVAGTGQFVLEPGEELTATMTWRW